MCAGHCPIPHCMLCMLTSMLLGYTDGVGLLLLQSTQDPISAISCMNSSLFSFPLPLPEFLLISFSLSLQSSDQRGETVQQLNRQLAELTYVTAQGWQFDFLLRFFHSMHDPCSTKLMKHAYVCVGPPQSIAALECSCPLHE